MKIRAGDVCVGDWVETRERKMRAHINKLLKRATRHRAPAPRKDARTYVGHGDRTWGNSICWRTLPQSHEVAVHGWLSAPFPRIGDRLLLKMESGCWGVYVFTESEGCADPKDMFLARAIGPIAYAEPEYEPRTRRPDEFIPRTSAHIT